MTDWKMDERESCDESAPLQGNRYSAILAKAFLIRKDVEPI